MDQKFLARLNQDYVEIESFDLTEKEMYVKTQKRIQITTR
jgi:hypothetical protein